MRHPLSTITHRHRPTFGVGEGEIATAVADKYLPKETEAARKALSPQYALLEEIVERIAKELGIQKEVMEIWHGAVSGASVGSAVGSIVGGAAAIGLCAGVIVGVVIVVVSLLTDDSEEQAERADQKFRDHLEWARTRLDFDSFAEEQRRASWDALGHVQTFGMPVSISGLMIGGLPQLEDIAEIRDWLFKNHKGLTKKQVDISIVAEQMAAVFNELDEVLTDPDLRALMLAQLNLSRWEQLRRLYLDMRAAKNKLTEDQDKQIVATVATLEHLITEEAKATEVTAAELAALEKAAHGGKDAPPPPLKKVHVRLRHDFKEVTTRKSLGVGALTLLAGLGMACAKFLGWL